MEVKFFVTNICPKCGSRSYHAEGEAFFCPDCKTKFDLITVNKINDCQTALDRYKQDFLANARQNLYQEVTKEHNSHNAIRQWCEEIKKYIPNDFFANFYLATIGKSHEIANFLKRYPVPQEYVTFVLDYLLRSVRDEIPMTRISAIMENLTINDQSRYREQFKKLMESINSCMYDTELPRNVFLAYSQIDQQTVLNLTEYLEKEEFSCFIAMRNLWNGIGTENYDKEIENAIDNCDIFVFLSTENSRRRSCGAYKELLYLSKHPEKKRVEYLWERYGEQTTDAIRDLLNNRIFSGLTQVNTPLELSCRIRDMLDNNGETPPTPPIHRHSYRTKVVSPTCLKKGYTVFECACGDHYEKNVVPATGHHYGDWKTVLPATVTKEGKKEKRCTVCYETVTEIIPKLKPSPLSDFEIENGVLEKYIGKETVVVIPDCVTEIGEDAFYDCTELTSVTIPNRVTTIGKYAFNDCSGLTSVTIPSSVTEIGEGAFYDCTGLTSVTIPNSVTTIGDSAFWGCTGLTSVTIPNSVTTIGDSAFYDCTGLTSVTIPNSVTEIGGGAFEGCTGLTSVTIPSSVTEIGDSAFYCCEGLTSVTIPSSVTTIGEEAFEGCGGLTSVTIPNRVTTIGEGAFYGCTGLTSITIPSSVTTIGDGAFGCCSNLTSILVDKGNTYYHVKGNCLIDTKTKTLIAGCMNSIIPDDGSVTEIGESAFSYCSELTSVTIPSSVTKIGEWAFEDCENLEIVYFRGTKEQWKKIQGEGKDDIQDIVVFI